MLAGNLEYLMASLPHLHFDDGGETRAKVTQLLQQYAGPLGNQKSVPEILDAEARPFLDNGDHETLRALELSTLHQGRFRDHQNPIVAQFSGFLLQMRQQLRQLRLQRRGQDDGSGQRKTHLPLTPGNPLEEEVQLLRLQWQKVEELCAGHYANFSALVGYKIKLLLLLRWWSFDADKGLELFDQATKKD
ncbi:hypothetical protein [Maribacter sp. 2307ULW6-5]|uniref:hypothetical protein n=1 Tax=Maribacter sp. 2307ULW6-5 TaxID=3386275 RepID=UPI0039BD44E4